MNTRTLFPTLAAAILLCAALACSLPGTISPSGSLVADTPTAAPATQAAANPSPTVQVATRASASPTPTEEPQTSGGIAVSYKGTSFLIQDGTLASGSQTETVAAVDDQGGAPWDVAPQHLKFTLDGYPLHDKFFSATIYVYPAKEYEDANNAAAESLKRLRAITSGAGMDVNNATLPFVPFFNATQTFEAQAQPLKFQNGSGIRVVTQYDQAPIPVNNSELIYHFEGLTDDGAYYVIAVFPLNLPTLPADNNPASVVPAGGIPFNQDDPAAYFAAVADQFNALAPEAFTPPLTSLDALVQSLKIVTP